MPMAAAAAGVGHGSVPSREDDATQHSGAGWTFQDCRAWSQLRQLGPRDPMHCRHLEGTKPSTGMAGETGHARCPRPTVKAGGLAWKDTSLPVSPV